MLLTQGQADLPQPAGGVEHLGSRHPRQKRPPLPAAAAAAACTGPVPEVSSCSGSNGSTGDCGGEAGVVGGVLGAEGEEVVEHDAEEVELGPHPELGDGGWGGSVTVVLTWGNADLALG
jgi:hypothetical protein